MTFKFIGLGTPNTLTILGSTIIFIGYNNAMVVIGGARIGNHSIPIRNLRGVRIITSSPHSWELPIRSFKLHKNRYPI
jgi:hypothetical protein